MKVFGVTGLPGSGKSIISRIAKSEGIHIISMGDVVRKEAIKTHTSSGAAAVNLRKKYGNNVVADRCVKEILNNSRNRNNKNTTTKIYRNYNNKNSHKKFKKIEQDIYLVEGIRSPQEVNYFKKYFKNFKIIAIHSKPEDRFNRLKRRKRVDDSPNYKDFQERDRREMNFGIGNVIALSDYMLVNEGPVPKFKKNVRDLITHEIKPKTNNKKQQQNKNKNYNKNKQNRRPRKGQKNYNKYNSKKRYNKQNKR